MTAEPSPLTVDTQSAAAEAKDTSEALWISLRGEADVTNLHQLQAALSRIELDGVGVVRIRLSELIFCDTQAFRQLFAFAQEVQHNGHVVFVHDASDVVRQLVILLAAQDTLKLA